MVQFFANLYSCFRLELLRHRRSQVSHVGGGGVERGVRGSSTQQVVVMMVIIIKFHLRGKAGPLSVGPRKRENSRNIIFKLESEPVSRPNVKFQEEGLGSKSCPYLLLAIIAYKALQLQGPWWWPSGQRSCLLL